MATTRKSSFLMAYCFPTIFLFVFISNGYAINLSGEEKEYLRAKDAVVFVSQTRYPPFEFTDANHQHEGMMLDVVRWMAVEMGFKPVFTDMTFQQAQEAVLSGKADILTSLFYSDKRKERFEFTETLFDVPASIFVRAERTDIKDLKDLNGKTIAIQRGDYAKDFLESQNIRFDKLDTENFAEATDMVISGKADAVIGDEQIVLYHIFSNRLTDYMKKMGEPLYIGRNCMASNKSNTILIGILNKGIHEAGRSGVLDKISKKWLGTKYGPQESFLERYLWPLSAVAGGLLLLSLWVWVWNIRLRTLVRKKTEVIVRREEALRESEEKYRTLSNNIPDFIYSLDKMGNVLAVNNPAGSRYGYEAGMLVGKPFLDVIHPDDREMVINSFLKAIEDHREYTRGLQFRVQVKDGTVLWVELNSHMHFDEKGLYLQEEGVLRDITERKRAEEALQASLSLLSAALESTADGILIVDRKGKITRWNQKFADMWKIPKEILSSHDDEKAINYVLKQLADPEQFAAKVRKLYEQPEESSFDQIEFLDGRVFERYSQPQRIEDNIVGRVWSYRDITGRKRAEDALRKSEEQYQTLVENANEAILVIQDGMVKFVNSKASESFGYTEQELLSTPIFELVHPEDRDAVIERYRQKIHGDMRPTLNTYRTIHKSGKTQWIEISSVKIEWEGRPATLNLVTNITERVKAEEEKQSLEERLSRAEKMESLGILAGGVAHDLNNVLGIVVGYADLLLLKTNESSAIRPQLVEIMKGGQKASAIVQDLLTLARRGVPGRDVLNLNKIITDSQRSPEFKQLSSFYSFLQIKTELDPDLLNISGSSVHLGKTIFNLISNACEAMKKGGCVTIKTFNRYLDKPIHGYDKIQEGDYVILSVSDTGEGINADDIKRIFEPFYTKKVMGRSGTGLGLAVVWGTVKDHNGYINVESEVGKGSTFTLYFPVTREELSAEHVAVSISEYMGKGESILLVDDVEGQRDLATEILRKLNYGVTSASSGEEAVAYLKEHKVDLMVLDMIMDPGMDGLDTYRQVLGIHPKQKAIIVSGFSESDRVKAAKALGAGAYVRKPYIIEKLGLAVRKELDRSA